MRDKQKMAGLSTRVTPRPANAAYLIMGGGGAFAKDLVNLKIFQQKHTKTPDYSQLFVTRFVNVHANLVKNPDILIKSRFVFEI
jgi:hypothetical protein